MKEFYPFLPLKVNEADNLSQSWKMYREVFTWGRGSIYPDMIKRYYFSAGADGAFGAVGAAGTLVGAAGTTALFLGTILSATELLLSCV